MATMTEREKVVFKMKLMELVEKYELMIGAFDELLALIPEGGDLTQDERNLLSVSYKQPVGSRRSACRQFDPPVIVGKVRDEKHERAKEALKNALKGEILDLSTAVLNTLDKKLIKPHITPEASVFYNKMKGDYHRYIAEFSEGADRDDAAAKSNDAYATATKVAAADLPPTHPIRLGLALNYSVYHYEIRNNPEAACKLAKSAFDDAISELDHLSEDSYKDSTLIMQLLRDNLTLWTADAEGEEEPKKSPEEKA